MKNVRVDCSMLMTDGLDQIMNWILCNSNFGRSCARSSVF